VSPPEADADADADAEMSLQPQAPPRPSWARRSVTSFLLLVLAGYAACLGYEVTQPAVPAANAPLAAWLSAHHLTHGLSGYWQSSSVTLDSAGLKGDGLKGAGLKGQGQVTVRALTNDNSGLVPYRWETKLSWFDWHTRYANFVVLENRPGTLNYWMPASQIENVFGRPASRYTTGPYTILVWHHNLLVTLHQREQLAS
jgi:hypothetical protein